jgi:hypothetical protein
LTTRNKSWSAVLLTLHAAVFAYLILVSPRSMIFPHSLTHGHGNISHFLRTIEAPLFLILWQALACGAALLIAPKERNIRLAIFGCCILASVLVLTKAFTLGYFLMCLVPALTLFLLFRSNANDGSLSSDNRQMGFPSHIKWKDMAYGSGVLALLLCLGTLVLALTDFTHRRNYGISGKGLTNVADTILAVSMLLAIVCMLAYSYKYVVMRKKRSAIDYFWPITIGTLAIGLAFALATASLISLLFIMATTYEMSGWVILLFPAVIVAIAIWFAGTCLAIYIIRKCLVTIMTGREGKVELGSLNPVLQKISGILTTARTDKSSVSDSPTSVPTPEPSTPKAPTFGKR